VAQSDLLAVGVLRVADELGIAVPAQLSVHRLRRVRLEGAIDGVLTTLVQPAVEKGRLAAAAVLAALAGRPDRSGGAAQRTAGRHDDGAVPGILKFFNLHKVVKEAYSRRP
jgi:DNA-binding LacI/PurR family transcriptional regulator